MSLIESASVDELAVRFPRHPGWLRHCLAAEPLLSHAALAKAADAMPPQLVERCVHKPGTGAEWRQSETASHAAEATAAGGAEQERIILRGVEHLPEYRALLHRLVDELAPMIAATTGPACDIKGVVSLSPPGTRTPFHFDAEYTILFQIAGTRIFAAFPPAPPYLDLRAREAYHRSGKTMLAWDRRWAGSAKRSGFCETFWSVFAPGDIIRRLGQSGKRPFRSGRIDAIGAGPLWPLIALPFRTHEPHAALPWERRTEAA